MLCSQPDCWEAAQVGWDQTCCSAPWSQGRGGGSNTPLPSWLHAEHHPRVIPCQKGAGRRCWSVGMQGAGSCLSDQALDCRGSDFGSGRVYVEALTHCSALSCAGAAAPQHPFGVLQLEMSNGRQHGQRSALSPRPSPLRAHQGPPSPYEKGPESSCSLITGMRQEPCSRAAAQAPVINSAPLPRVSSPSPCLSRVAWPGARCSLPIADDWSRWFA